MLTITVNIKNIIFISSNIAHTIDIPITNRYIKKNFPIFPLISSFAFNFYSFISTKITPLVNYTTINFNNQSKLNNSFLARTILSNLLALIICLSIIP